MVCIIPHPSPLLRETDKLWIAGYPIRSDVVSLEPVLHVYSARFIKVDASALHDTHDLLFACIVQPLARVAGFYIATEIKCRRRKPGLDVIAE